jgi:CheY-like chemotaxis protein
MPQNFEELAVLIAEDSEDDLILLQRALLRANVRNPQIVTMTGREAIAALEEVSGIHHVEERFPVVLFLDLHMPKVDGIEVLEWLREHSHPPITIVLHTGVEDESLLERARDLGATLYLPKGVRPEAIREVFRRARAEWERSQLVQH